MKSVQERHGVTPEQFVEDRLYLIPTDKLDELDGKDRFVLLAAEKMQVSYGRALATMYDLKNQYGITFSEFNQQKFFAYKTARARRVAVRRYIEREGEQVQKVCHETGWSPEVAEEKMRAAKKKWPTIDFRKYAGYGFFAQTDKEISERVRGWNTTAKANRKSVMEETGWSEQQVREHMTRFQMVYDIIPAYYMCYRGWELSDEQIDGYARQKLSQRLSNRFNVKSDLELLGQKDIFDHVYSEHVNRKFFVNRDGSTLEDFLEFADGIDEAFCKPLRSGGGLGTFKLDLKVGREQLTALYNDLMSKPLVLVEESVQQHSELNEFYPHSVNTVRVVTLQDEEGVHIISTGIRFGGDSITDNFSADGFVCDVDKETGVIVTPGVNKKGVVAESHPYSNKRFVGAQVPHWDQVLKIATEAMSVLSGVNFVGWDVAISPDRVSLIEGNSAPDLVLVQAPYAPQKIGKRYLFDPFLSRKTKYPAEASGVTPESLGISTASAAGAAAPTGSVAREDFRVDVVGGKGTIRKYLGSEQTVQVPAEVNGVPIIAIGPGAFEANTTVRRVVLPNGLERMGRRAFANTPGLVEIELPETLREIGDRAFEGTSSLEHVELPDALTELRPGTFRRAKRLQSVGLPYGLTRIGKECFKECESLHELYYFSKRGISDVMTSDRALREDALPNEIKFVGAGAFSFCRSLTRVDVPYLVQDIAAETFLGCRSLSHVGLHNQLKSIGKKAFRGCVALKELHVPFTCKKFGKRAFSQKTLVRAGKTSPAVKYAEEAGYKWDAYSYRGSQLVSSFDPAQHTPGSESDFFTMEDAAAVITRHELRHPSYIERERSSEPSLGDVPRARFSFEDGIYRSESQSGDTCRIMMVGDLMARRRQQEVALREDGSPFDFSLQYVRNLFQEADFVTGNLESTVSSSAPYTVQREHVNGRPHLNAPRSFLAALRRSGFDAVTLAQNHIYDTGTRGVLETLSAANQCQLIHTGAFASPEDPRYVVVEINGIKVGLVAYLDSARQMMKKANFTKRGRDVMFPYFDPERVAEDIRAARESGAEFIIASCHWGREYTSKITSRQREFAQLVADAGADYIVGAHSHCIQHYEILHDAAGRNVPCLWSASNFVSNMNIQPPITRDSLVIDLTLKRQEDASVTLIDEKYHPCRIMNLKDGEVRNCTVVPTSHRFNMEDLDRRLDEARERIIEAVGEGIQAAK
ncbi:CapA family protein [uncultured Agrococcus sp.]|uniref:CapA family protein n=1 Tax=uncultured Agrococcus sp. TaxID=382258 RepID=UPI0025E6DAD1|nr:CapA family protein [uncultured Agrococcus sp.]